jgi:hypothetical protein
MDNLDTVNAAWQQNLFNDAALLPNVDMLGSFYESSSTDPVIEFHIPVRIGDVNISRAIADFELSACSVEVLWWMHTPELFLRSSTLDRRYIFTGWEYRYWLHSSHTTCLHNRRSMRWLRHGSGRYQPSRAHVLPRKHDYYTKVSWLSPFELQ